MPYMFNVHMPLSTIVLISEKECLLLGPTGTCVKKVFEEREMYC